MEFLQCIQHSYLAVPDDNYSMCHNATNQALTWAGIFHICFQPVFVNFAIMGLYRQHSVRDRVETELIQNLCWLGGCWSILAYIWAAFLSENGLAPPATKDCPNYNWLREGYDEHLDFVTPNIPNNVCTYLSPTEEGHLAWVIPWYHLNYYTPSSSLHAFLMFAPYLLMARRRPVVAVLSVLLFLSGPVLSAFNTPSINEQAAIWCYGSVFQCIALVVTYRCLGVPTQESEHGKRMIVEGKLGEQNLVYTTTYAGSSSNSTSGLAAECDMLLPDEQETRSFLPSRKKC